jgi:hypothetical protein
MDRFYNGQALLPYSPDNVKEAVGIFVSYGYVLEAYQENLQHIADRGLWDSPHVVEAGYAPLFPIGWLFGLKNPNNSLINVSV